MEEFLQSKPMLTPGAAGTAVTVITGTIVEILHLPGSATGIVVSFIVGLIVWVDVSLPVPQRILFYVLNSVTIFCVASGINEAGVAWTMSDAPPAFNCPPQVDCRSVEIDQGFFQSWY